MEPQIIKGNSRLVGLLGNPVAHSLSPLFQNHIFRKLNLPFVYIPLEVKKENLHTALHALRTLNFAGANITIPYKKDVLHYCDVLSDLSEITGTVNTLYFKDGLLHGTTTDADGFFKALLDMGHDVTNGDIVVLGNGGTARTLGFALVKYEKINSLTFIGRDQGRVGTLTKEINEKTGFPVKMGLFTSKECKESLKKCSLLVNTTSVGMHPDSKSTPLTKDLFHENMTVFDTIYNPAETMFLHDAKEAGCKTQNGLRMLLYQGLESFKHWTGVEASLDLLDINEIQDLI
jgi:shikimate dehydrogenase